MDDLLPCDPRRTVPLTLPAALDLVAALAPAAPIAFPDLDPSGEDETLTAAELARRAHHAAGALAAHGVGPGDRVGVLSPNAPEFLVAVFGATRIGAAAAPLALPLGADLADWVDRLHGVLDAAGISHVVVSHRIVDRVGPALAGVVTVLDSRLFPDAAPGPAVIAAGADDPAVVQFTSGSTARPKGVVLRHRNVWHCARAITEAIALGPGDVHGSWLPLFHDMGLFGALTGIFAGIPVHLWSPAGFVRRPARWLESFAARRGTIATMPNFGYDALVAAVDAEHAARLDLSSWRVAFNGAEAVSAPATAAFLERFAPAGFSPRAMVPSYGMAEVTLAATVTPPGRGPVVEHVDRATLTAEGRAVPSRGADTRALVGLGTAVPGMEVRVAEGDDVRPDGVVGEIQMRGPMVTDGYVGAVEQPFTPEGWLCSGDLGYRRDGELFFTGRRKEMVTVVGRNLYPADVEELVRDLPGVHRGRTVALAGTAPDGRERIEVVVETSEDAAAMESRVRAAVAAALGALPLAVIPVPPRTIPRTTSGKLRRLDTRSAVRSRSPQEGPS